MNLSSALRKSSSVVPVAAPTTSEASMDARAGSTSPAPRTAKPRRSESRPPVPQRGLASLPVERSGLSSRLYDELSDNGLVDVAFDHRRHDEGTCCLRYRRTG